MLNTTNLSNSFHGQTSLRDTITFLICLRKALMDSYIFSIWYKLIHFSLPLNRAIHRMGNVANNLCLRCKEQEESQHYFIFFFLSFPKLLWDFISELINLKYAFNITFEITLKTIIMGTSFKLHDGVQLKKIFTLSSEILLLKWCSVKKVFLEISQNSLENTCVRVSFLIKLQTSRFRKKLLRAAHQRCS